MLSDGIIIDKHITPLPSVQDSDLIRDPGEMGQVFLRDRSAVAIELLRDLLPRLLDIRACILDLDGLIIGG